VGGWAALSPKITVMAKAVTAECAQGEENPDVPTANACFHQLKLPAYTSMEVMRERLVWAMGKGTGTFDLT
jgi:E3 ubiquitin-protein ligase TRIP12